MGDEDHLGARREFNVHSWLAGHHLSEFAEQVICVERLEPRPGKKGSGVEWK